MLNKEKFEAISIKEYNHAEKYAKLLNSSTEDLLLSTDSNTVQYFIDKSIKMGTLSFKNENDYIEVKIRNISGNPFAYYPSKNSIVISKNSLNRLLK